MAASTPTIDPWTPPSAGADWWPDPRARANYLAALERHNEHAFSEAVEFLGMWRSEIAGEATEPLALEDRADTETAELIAELVRVAHGRRRLDPGVAVSFKRVAAAVGVSAERLAAAVRGALDSEVAA